MGKIIATNISEKKGTQKHNVQTVHVIEDFGIENDAHAGKWHRQISLLAYEEINTFKNTKAATLDPSTSSSWLDKLIPEGAFGENFIVEGIDFVSLPIGTKFKCNEVILELTQIGKECHTGCNIAQAMGECIMPKKGVFARVLHGGTISVGDIMEVIA